MRSSWTPILLALFLASAVARPSAAVPNDSTGTVDLARQQLLAETASAGTAFTGAHDSWTGFDKVQHATFSLLCVLSTQYVLENKAGWSGPGSLPLSVGLTATLGIAKEVYDWRISSSRHFSERDLVANVLGMALAILVVKL